MEKIELKKRYKLFNKEYYYLMKNDNVIGKAWITTKTNFLRWGLYFKIIPTMRNKGYGTKFYKLLVNRMSNNAEAFLCGQIKK